MKYLFGDVLHPIDSPLRWFCFVGFLSHWTWGWFAAWLASGLACDMLSAWAAGRVCGRVEQELLHTYLGDSRDRYRLEKVPIRQEFLAFFNIVVAIGEPGRSVDESVRVFVVRATKPKYLPGITSRCLHYPDGPTIVFLRQPLENLDEAGFFEVFHEIGHASHGGLETELCQFGEIPAIFLSATVLLMAFPNNGFIRWLAGAYMLVRLLRWALWVRTAEAEVSSDLYAVKYLAEMTGLGAALSAAQIYIASWIDEYNKRSIDPRKVELRCRIRALRRCARLLATNQKENIPYHPRSLKKGMFLLFLGVFLVCSLLADAFPWPALKLLGLTFAVAIVSVAFTIRSRVRLKSEISTRIDRLTVQSGRIDMKGTPMPFPEVAFKQCNDFRKPQLRVVGAESARAIAEVVDQGEQPEAGDQGPGGRRNGTEFAVQILTATVTVAKFAYDVYRDWRAAQTSPAPTVLRMDDEQFKQLVSKAEAKVETEWPLPASDKPDDRNKIIESTIRDTIHDEMV
jgi:hypothetical protein